MHHQNRDGALFQVLGEIGLRESDDAVVMRLRAAHHALAPPIPNDRFQGFHPWSVEAIEGSSRQIVIELGSVGRELGLQIIEHFFRKTAGIFLCLHYQRWHRADQRRLRYPAFAMPSQIMRHFAAAGRMANVHGVLQIKMRGQSRKVVGVVIHVMAATSLSGAAMASSVVGYDAIAVLEKEQHLRVPVIDRQRPAMTEDDGLSFAPVLIIDVDVSSIFFSDSYVWHGSGSFCEVPAGRVAVPRRLHASRHKLSRDFSVTLGESGFTSSIRSREIGFFRPEW